MKVKVRKIASPYTDVPTESLQAICRNHAHDKLHVHIGTKQLYDIMGVLADRRKASGCYFRSNEEAWAEFVRHYMPREDAVAFAGESLQENLLVPHKLTPSLGGKECLGNGKWLGYQCQCCDCDWYATICFPDGEE